MARKRMVTRTIKTLEVEVLCLDISTQETVNKSLILSGTYKDNKSLMKAVSNILNSETLKAVHVTDSTEKETLYGMDENDFITYASELPPREQQEKEI